MVTSGRAKVRLSALLDEPEVEPAVLAIACRWTGGLRSPSFREWLETVAC